MGIEVHGVAEVVNELEEFADAVDHLDPALERIAERGTAVLRPFIRVSTGALRASARGEVVNGAAVISVGGPTIRYAGAVNARDHFTTRAQPGLTAVAALELEAGANHLIETRGLNQ
jgi:hypothetical protein